MPFIVTPLPDPAGKKHMGGIDPRHTRVPPRPRDDIFTLGEDAVAVDEGGVHDLVERAGMIGFGSPVVMVAAENVPGGTVDEAHGAVPAWRLVMLPFYYYGYFR